MTWGTIVQCIINTWPEYNDKYLVAEEITIVVQINGKVRANIVVATDASEDTIVEAAKADTNITTHLENGIRKTIYVPKKSCKFCCLVLLFILSLEKKSKISYNQAKIERKYFYG